MIVLFWDIDGTLLTTGKAGVPAWEQAVREIVQRGVHGREHAGVVGGRTLTSYPSLQTDLKNAGARWVDQEVVVDNGLVTSRNPNDIPAFNRKMIEEFAESRHAQRQVGV